MNYTAFYFFVSAIVFIFGLYEIHFAKPKVNVFAAGIFTFVLQYIILPYVFIFISWAMSTVSTVAQIQYIFALFLSSFAIAVYHFFKVYQYYMSKEKEQEKEQ